ncbi:MAG: methyltransferase domain-containing protein [Pseudomonadota bacterium]
MAIHETHETGFTFRHRLPRGRPVDRHAALLEAARGRRVIHVGFVDELVEQKVEGHVWLHARLGEVARELVGLDSSERGVAWAQAQGYEAHAVDCQSEEDVRALGLPPADVVVAGEILEHLDAPGPFLRAMRLLATPDGALLVTTPNAYRLLNFLAPLSGSELVHPDHTLWSSPRTLRTLLEHAGWRVERLGYYANPGRSVVSGSPAAKAAGHAANAARWLVRRNRLAPWWSDGLIAWARPA